jgi:hypothetical protein
LPSKYYKILRKEIDTFNDEDTAKTTHYRSPHALRDLAEELVLGIAKAYRKEMKSKWGGNKKEYYEWLAPSIDGDPNIFFDNTQMLRYGKRYVPSKEFDFLNPRDPSLEVAARALSDCVEVDNELEESILKSAGKYLGDDKLLKHIAKDLQTIAELGESSHTTTKIRPSKQVTRHAAIDAHRAAINIVKRLVRSDGFMKKWKSLKAF